MLDISKAQMAVFDDAATERFVVAAGKSLREDDDEGFDFLGDDELHQLVRLGIRMAKDGHYSWESSIAGFVSLMMGVGPKFFEHSGVREAFHTAEQRFDDEDERLAWAVQNIPPATWEAAAENGWARMLPLRNLPMGSNATREMVYSIWSCSMATSRRNWRSS